MSDESRVQQLHAEAVVIDAHADIEIPGRESPYVGPDGRSRVTPDKLEAGDMNAVVLALATAPRNRDEVGYAAARRSADRKLQAVHALVDDPANKVRLARSSAEILAARDDGNRALVLGFQNALIIGKDLSGLNEYFDAGARVFALNHIGHNDYADSSRPTYLADQKRHEPTEEHGGLSELGIQAVKRLNDMGVLFDVSQLSKNAVLQALEILSGPAIATHSNVKALCDVSRNLSDEEIDGVAASGGLVCVSPFIGYLYDTSDDVLISAIAAEREKAGLPEHYLYPFELYWELPDPEQQKAFRNTIRSLLGVATVSHMVDHLDYVVQRVGVDHVGIGSDFNHGGGVAGFNEASEALNVTVELDRRGYEAEEIAKIWGGNFLRAMHEACGEGP